MRRTFVHTNSPQYYDQDVKSGQTSTRGSLLADIEFLTRYTPAGLECTCIYPEKPEYIEKIKELFPLIRFVTYGGEVYDPNSPSMDFTKVTAREWGSRDEMQVPLVMIMHTVDPLKQTLYHVLAKPDFSLFQCDAEQDTFIQGELLFPVYSSVGSSSFYKVAPKSARAVVYDLDILNAELAHFQFVERGSQYDEQAENLILTEYVLKTRPGVQANIDLIASMIGLTLQPIQQSI